MSRGLRPAIRGKLSFDDVSFTYGASPIPALDRVSFEVEPGQAIGIVGRSGSGKSTVLRLLQGLYPVQRGLIRIDDYDIRELDKVYLRQHMAVVLPESFLFRGTIRDNIAAGKSNAAFEEIAWAARTWTEQLAQDRRRLRGGARRGNRGTPRPGRKFLTRSRPADFRSAAGRLET